MRIVLTRPRGRGDAWKERLAAAGHEVELVPLTEIRDGDPFPDPTGYDGVLFTSVAAVERAPEGVRWPRVGAVGEITAAALAERSIGVDVVGHGGGAELAQAWARDLQSMMGHRLLLPQARRAHTALEVALRAMGAEVDCVAVYETLPAPRVDRGALERAEVIAFFAPSAVRMFRRLQVETRARFWGAGATTRAAMAEAGFAHAGVEGLEQ
jgi:uroporphyrinogen-III synthase